MVGRLVRLPRVGRIYGGGECRRQRQRHAEPDAPTGPFDPASHNLIELHRMSGEPRPGPEGRESSICLRRGLTARCRLRLSPPSDSFPNFCMIFDKATVIPATPSCRGSSQVAYRKGNRRGGAFRQLISRWRNVRRAVATCPCQSGMSC